MSTDAPPRLSQGRFRRDVVAALVATKWLALGAGTAILSLVSLVLLLAVALLTLVGVGLLLLGPALGVVRWVADLERRRLTAMGAAVESPYGPVPTGWREVWRFASSDVSTRRDVGWLAVHATLGLALGLLPLELASNAIQELSTPLWWSVAPAGSATLAGGLIPVETWAAARWGLVTGLLWAVLWFGLSPHLSRWQAAPGRGLLPPHPDVDLSARIAQLTASRAAALDAHAVELRRIERALHDGTQNRLVAVTVLAGAARQALARDPESVGPVLDRVQEGAELALAELRSVVRSILPPVLEADGLPGALSALAAQCAVETRVEVRVPSRCPIAIEAVAYYTVAEALTNVTRHSGADRASVRVTQHRDCLHIAISDDGSGGARFAAGSGLAGIRDRVGAHEGTMRVESPTGGPTVIEVVLPCG